MRLFLLLFIYFVSFGFSGQVFSQCNPPGTPTPGLGEFACLEAPLLCSISELDGYTNCTAPSGVGICPAPFCGSCENYQWFSFIATSSIVSVSITPSNCVEQPNGSGLQAHIYETVDCENFISVSNCESPSSNIPITVTSIDLEIGEKYYLMIDGWAGDECDYEIEVLEGGSLPPGGDILTISGDTSFCLTSYTMEYTVITDPDTALVNWTIDPPLGEIILGQGGNTIQVQWGFAGQAQLCADTGAECGEGEEVCIDISIELGPPIVHEHLICPGDTVFCEDLIITEPGEYVAGDTTLLTGCLSEIICAVDWAPTDTTHLGTILLCNDDCFSADTLYCEAGEYEYSILASDGCDSVIQFQIATLSSNVEILPLPDTLCPGTTLLSADTSLVLSDSTVWESELIWSGPGILGDSTQLSVEVAISGTYFISYSIRQYNSVCTVFDSINVEFDLPIIDSLAVSICEGDSVTIGNSVYAEPGMYADTLVAYSGCDSVVMLSLSVDSILYSSLESTICEGDSLFFGNEFLDSAGVYEATFISQLGCDSVVSLNLSLLPIQVDSQQVSICEGETISYADSLIVTSGTYEFFFSADSGCDSIVILEVEEIPSLEVIQDVSLCLGDSLVVGDSTYLTSGSYLNTFESQTGCDSLVITNLEVKEASTENYFFELCAGDSLIFNGQTYYDLGTYVDTAYYGDGCDSVYFSLFIDAGYQTLQLQDTICEGDIYPFNGQDLTEPGIYYDTLVPPPGQCGDVIELKLHVWETTTYFSQDTLCFRGTIKWEDIVITEPGEYFVLEPNGPFGCFDTLLLEVIANPPIELLSYEIESSFLTQTGSIYPEWGGGTPPLTFEWSSGQNTPFIENVPFANYLVTVIDSRNCFQSWGFQLGGVIGDPGIQFSSRPLKLWPNPLDKEELHLELPEGYDGPGTLELLSVHGQSVMKTEVGFAGGRVATKVGDLPAGVYFLRLRVGQEVWTERVQVF